MFRGEIPGTIDGKGRASIPVKFRETLLENFADDRFFITKCPVELSDGQFCRGLSIYPRQEWLAIEARTEQEKGLTASQLNSLRRMLFAPATECSVDKQGRVLIPPALRSYANLERNIVIVGMPKKVEIWSTESWELVTGQAEKDLPLHTEILGGLGF